MDKKLKVYLNYDAETMEYSIIPQELEAHQIYAFGADVTDTIEELITLIDDVPRSRMKTSVISIPSTS